MTIRRQIIIGFLLLLVSTLHAERVDSLLQVITQLESNESEEELLDVLYELLRTYEKKGDFTKVLETAQNALSLSESIGVVKHRAEILYFIGYGYDRTDQYELALEHYENLISELPGIPVQEGEDRQDIIWRIHDRLASVNRNMGKLEKSYKFQLKALETAENAKDTSNLGTSLYQLGSFFFYQQQYTKALEHYKKAQNCFDNSDNKRMIYACVAAIGTTYGSLDSLEKSLEYNKESLAIAKEIDYQLGVAYSLSNVGSTYIALKNYDKAYDILTSSLRMKEESNDKWGQIGTLRSLAEMFILKGDPQKAIPYLDQAYQLAVDIKSKPRQLELIDLFSQAYKRLGDYKNAMTYMESFIGLKDSVLNEQTVAKLGEQKESYEVKQKEKEILLLQKQKEVLERDQEIEQLYNYIWTVLACGFGLLLLLFVSRYRTQKRSSKALADKNEKINIQNEQLQKVNNLLSETNDLLEENKKKIEEQNKALESSNEDLRNFASVASHDLKEPLRMINSYTSILKRRYEPLFDDRAKEFMGFVVDGCTRMEQMINSLLDYSRVSLNGAVDKFKLIQSGSVVDIVQSNLRYSITKHSATINVDNKESFPIIRADQSQMMQLFQNLISNAIKFKGERLPVVHVGCKTEGDTHTFYIKDNGIGISKENQEKIFDMLTRLHSKQEYEGTGIGLATVRKIVERHDGRIWVESVEGEGSTFFFTVPVVEVAEPAAN